VPFIAYLIILTDRIERISRLKSTDRISQTFLTNVKSKLSDEQDFYWFAKKIGISQELIVSNSSEESDTTTTEDSSTRSESELTYNIQETPPIKAFEHKRNSPEYLELKEKISTKQISKRLIDFRPLLEYRFLGILIFFLSIFVITALFISSINLCYIIILGI